MIYDGRMLYDQMEMAFMCTMSMMMLILVFMMMTYCVDDGGWMIHVWMMDIS